MIARICAAKTPRVSTFGVFDVQHIGLLVLLHGIFEETATFVLLL